VKRRPLEVVVVPLAFAAFYAAFFAPVLLDGRILAPGEALFYYLPSRVRLASVPAPGWEPLLFSGFPVQGDPQAMAWYPLAWALSRSDAGWNALVLAAYVLASSLTYGYVAALVRSRLAAGVSGLVYGASGFLMAHLGHTSMIQSAAWIPGIVWSLHALRRRGSPGALAAAACTSAASILGGHPQLAVYGLALGLAYVLFLVATGEADGPALLLRAAAGVGLGIGLAAVCWVPAWDLARETTRAALGLRAFLAMSLRGEDLLRLVLPWAYGGWHGGVGSMPFFARSDVAEATGFVGLLPIGLAAVALAVRPRERTAWFWAGAAVASLVISLGRYLHLAELLFLVPIYDRFRIMPRHLALFSLSMAVLAGLGVAALERLDGDARRRAVRRVSAALAVAVGIAVVGVTALLAGGIWAKYLARVGLEGWQVAPWRNPMLAVQLCALAIGLAALAAFGRAPSRLAGAGLLLAIALDLASFGGFAEWRDSPGRAALELPPSLIPYRDELARSQQRLTPALAFAASAAAPPDLNLLWGIASTGGLGPLVLTRYAELLGVGPAGFVSWDALRPENRALDVLASRYLLAPSAWLDGAPPALREALVAPRWRRLPGSSGVAAFENARALPRAWLVSELRAGSADAVRAAIQQSRLPDGSAFDPAVTALVEEPPPRIQACAGACEPVRVVRVEPTRLALESRAPGPSFLVASDVFDAGWRAALDAAPVRVWRTDYCLRGVEVPAGTHRVDFEFHSDAFRAGAFVSAASAIGLLLLLGASRSARRP